MQNLYVQKRMIYSNSINWDADNQEFQKTNDHQCLYRIYLLGRSS